MVKVGDLLKNPRLAQIYHEVNKSSRSWILRELLPTLTCSPEVKDLLHEEFGRKLFDAFGPLLHVQESLSNAMIQIAQKETFLYQGRYVKKSDFRLIVKNLKKKVALQIEQTAKNKYYSLTYIDQILTEKKLSIQEFCARDEYLFLEMRAFLKSKDEAVHNGDFLVQLLKEFSDIHISLYPRKKDKKSIQQIIEANHVVKELMQSYHERAFLYN